MLLGLNNENINGLLHGCLQNNRESQYQLYMLLHNYASSIAHLYTSDTQEANEIVNDSFLKLFKKIHSFLPANQVDIVPFFKGWFRRIIINTCIDRYRKKSRVIITEISVAESPVMNGETGEDRLSYKEIIDAIRHLSPAYRTVFNLYVMEGFTHEEISVKLGISIGTSKSNLFKARENLRNFLINKNNYYISFVFDQR